MAQVPAYVPRGGVAQPPRTGNRYLSALGAAPTGPSALGQAPSTPVSQSAPLGYGQTNLNKQNVQNAYGGGEVREKQAALTSGANAQTQQQNQASAYNTFTGLLNQDPSTVLQAYVNSAMPQFNQALQGVRENDVQRGISTGDLGTAYEGSLASAFQRNIAGEAANLYGTQLGAAGQLYGQTSANALNSSNQYQSLVGGLQDQWQQERAQKSNFLSGILGGLGTIGGAVLGGPLGAGIAGSVFGSNKGY